MVSFGNQPINTTTAPKAVLLQNAGTAGLSVASVTLTGTNPGDFILANNGCSTLAPGGTCSITVQFKPTTANSRSARLRIVDNASGSPHLIPLVGNGIDPAVRPKVIGPIDARNGYPASITDQNGVTLGLCWDDPNLCLTTLPDLTAPPAVRDDVVNFPDESFWYSLEAEIDPWPFGQRALLVIAQEAAFVGDMVPGGQAMFGRVRIRVDGLQPLTTYRFTHPYGRDLITTDEDGKIFSTEDIGCLSTPCDYTLATTSRVWPFLKWDPNVAPAAPAGYLGDFNVLHPVVGSPIGQNVFRIEQVNGSNFQLIGETNLFALSGKIVGAPAAPPPVGTVIVPDVVQQLQADAQGNISGAGLAVGGITTATSSTVSAGRVISQSPAAGASVAAGSAVARGLDRSLARHGAERRRPDTGSRAGQRRRRRVDQRRGYDHEPRDDSGRPGDRPEPRFRFECCARLGRDALGLARSVARPGAERRWPDTGGCAGQRHRCRPHHWSARGESCHGSGGQ